MNEEGPRWRSMLAADFHQDCLHFRSDRPCRPHKATGVVCPGCPEYRPATSRILIVKLDAMGDVLRTTCVLPPLMDRYPGAHVTWITMAPSVPLLENNPHVHRILAFGPESLVVLATEDFDVALNLDSAPKSSSLMAMARARERIGFQMSPRGQVEPLGEEAAHWFRMGLSDARKKANTRTYQDLMCSIAGLDATRNRYVLVLTDEERHGARSWLTNLGVDPARPLVGLNTGAGGRWQYKRWRLDGYRELSKRLIAKAGATVLLLGGAEEEVDNRELVRSIGPGVHMSGVLPVRRFAALVGECSVVVTGDTLAMHMALALERPTIVPFGPTSSAEIEMYGLGEKLVPDMDCLVCYKETCDLVPACMDLITTDQVEAAVHRALRALPTT